MRAVSVIEKPLKPMEIPAYLPCHGERHYFTIHPTPPGTVCACGKKAMIYEPCAACQQAAPALRDVVQLQEGDHV